MRGVEVQLDLRVMLFALLLAFCSTLFYATAPAWQAARVDLVSFLKAGLPGAGERGSRLRGLLIAGQIGLSLALLATAGTVIEATRRALLSDPIARPDELVLGEVDLTVEGYSAAEGQRFYEALLDQVRALPGVTAASLGSIIPPQELSGRRAIFLPGQEPPPEVLQGRDFALGLRVDWEQVAPGFLRTLGIPLAQGREFSGRPCPGTRPPRRGQGGEVKQAAGGQDERRHDRGEARQLGAGPRRTAATQVLFVHRHEVYAALPLRRSGRGCVRGRMWR